MKNKQPSKLWVLGSNPNGITKRMDATVADRGVCRRRGPPSSLERTPSVANDIVASATWRPSYAHELAPRRGRETGAQRRNPKPRIRTIEE